MTITTIEQLKEYQAQGDNVNSFKVKFNGFTYTYTARPSEVLAELKKINGGKL